VKAFIRESDVATHICVDKVSAIGSFVEGFNDDSAGYVVVLGNISTCSVIHQYVSIIGVYGKSYYRLKPKV